MVAVSVPTSRNDLGPAPPPGKTPFFVYILVTMAVIGGFLFGYDCGVVAGALVVLREYWGDNVITDLWQELIVSMTVASAAVFSLIGGVVNDKFGRRKVTLAASVLFVVGAIVMAVSPNRNVLLVGRLIVGAAIGLSSTTVPSYVAECSPPHIRGRMITMFQLMITIGFWLAGVLDATFSYLPNNISWRLMLGFAGIPAAVQLVGFFFMPESPRWLAQNGRDDEAYEVLLKVTSSPEVAKYELKGIMYAHEEAERERKEQGGGSVFMTMIKTPNLRRALIVGCSMQMFQQLCGINTVMYYSTSIIKMGGVRDTTTAIWFTSITSGFNFLCTFIGLYFVEKLGRRKLTLISVAGVITMLCVLAASFIIIDVTGPNLISDAGMLGIPNDRFCGGAIDDCDGCSYKSDCGFCYDWSHGNVTGNDGICLKVDPDNDAYAANMTFCSKNMSSGSNSNFPDAIFAKGWCPSDYSWLPIIGMVLYLVSFSSGFGPMPWTINAEIYPAWARSTGNACATATNWVFNLIIAQTFLTLVNAISRQGAFFVYAGITTIGWIWFFFVVPETKNKSLEELDQLFVKPLFSRRSKVDDSSYELKGKPDISYPGTLNDN